MTTTEAAQYLASRGFVVSRGRVGGCGSPSADTIKRWCVEGRLAARKSGWVWLIRRDELDRYAAERRKAAEQRAA